MAKSKGDGISKAQMVRDALGALGGGAKPQAIQEHIKGAHGVEIPTVMISSYKSSMKKKGGKGGRRGRVGRPAGSGGGGGIISDITAVRVLISKHGKPGLVKLIDAIG